MVVWGLLAAALAIAAGPSQPTVSVGLASYAFVDSAHADTIRAAIWYPSSGTARDTMLALQPLHVALGGPYVPPRAPAPARALIVISHGTGGDQFGHWDTAEALARAGYIVATIRHAGDNSRDHSGLGTDRYLYGRPEQMSRLLDRLLADSVWAPRIDAHRIGFFGYSAGGFTGLELLGARPNVQLLQGYCARHPRDPLYCAGGLRGRFHLLGRYSPANRDARIRAVALWAPAFSFLFDSAALTRVANTRTPLLVVRGTSDSVVVEPDNVAHLERFLGRLGEFTSVAGAGHYSFLPPCGPELARIVPDICVDPPGVSRVAVHRELDSSLVAFFARAWRGRS